MEGGRESGKERRRERERSGQIKKGVSAGFRATGRVVVFDTFVDTVINDGVKTLLVFYMHYSHAGFSIPTVPVCLVLLNISFR